LITDGAGGDQPGARRGPIGSHSQPGFAKGPKGTADQVGTGGCPAVEPAATDEPADHIGLFAASATRISADQTGRAVEQTRPRTKPQPWRSGVFAGIDAMAFRGCWLQSLTLGGESYWRMERLPAGVVPPPRGPVLRPRGVGLGRLRVQRPRAGCLSPPGFGSARRCWLGWEQAAGRGAPRAGARDGPQQRLRRPVPRWAGVTTIGGFHPPQPGCPV